MTLTDEFTLIESTLCKQGFKLTPYFQNSMTVSHFVVSDTDLYRKKIDSKFSYEAFFGHWLEVREVSRRNGAKYNTSYYLVVCECERSSSKDVKKIKLMSSQTETTLVKKITNFALYYKDYVYHKKFEEVIDNLLAETKLD